MATAGVRCPTRPRFWRRWRMKLRSLSAVAFLLLAWAGCASVVVDRHDRILISGKIQDESGDLLRDAKCFFVDSGLGDWRHGKFESSILASSDQLGRVHVLFNYSWGYELPGSRPRELPAADIRHFSISRKKAWISPFSCRIRLQTSRAPGRVCQHERKHLMQMREPRIQRLLTERVPTRQITNLLECEAYGVGSKCLSRLYPFSFSGTPF